MIFVYVGNLFLFLINIGIMVYLLYQAIWYFDLEAVLSILMLAIIWLNNYICEK